MFNDCLLRAMYVEFGIPCDRLVSNPATLARFASDYTHRSGHAVELAPLAHHLLNLRRRGEANGGLSRLQRAYNGRN